MTEPFEWFSPLGASVILFLVIGTLWFAIGALTVPLTRRRVGPPMLAVSERTDHAYFGRAPTEILARDPVLAKFRMLMITWLAGFFLVAGTLVVFITWFGLRREATWALVALALSTTLGTALWAVALVPYIRAGIRLTLADIPPFIWVPAILVAPALILGVIGTR